MTSPSTSRARTKISPSDLAALGARVRRPILTPRSPGYDAARTLWNAMIDRRPSAIVQCSTPDEVASAVRVAAERDLLVSIRAGGHNVAGNACCDDGLMIDLSPMQDVQVDPGHRTARVEAGATLGVVDRETQRHGLATPLGINLNASVSR